MKKLIFLLFPILITAQTKNTVRDSLTGKPIKYVNIWVENEDISVMADSLGQYIIKTTNAGKTIVFSAAGYKSKKVKLPEVRGLKLSPISLPEPEKSIGTKAAKLGGNYSIGRADLTFGSHGKPWMLARKFTSAKLSEVQFLKKITLATDCHNNNMKCSLRFFDIGADGNPGKELADSLVIFRVDRGRDDTTVDLSAYKIRVPQNGFFVAYSWLIISQNVKIWYDHRPMQYKDYDPGIGAEPTDENETWQYIAGKWSPLDRMPEDFGMKSYRNKFVKLAMEVTLSN